MTRLMLAYLDGIINEGRKTQNVPKEGKELSDEQFALRTARGTLRHFDPPTTAGARAAVEASAREIAKAKGRIK